MADSITVIFTETESINNSNIRIVKIEWVDSPSLKLNTSDPKIDCLLQGWYCFMGETIPGAGGAAPDANYDIAVTNNAGTDIFGTALNNRSQTANETAIPTVGGTLSGPFPIKLNDELTFTVTGQTNANGAGTCYLYFARY